MGFKASMADETGGEHDLRCLCCSVDIEEMFLTTPSCKQQMHGFENLRLL